MGVFFPARGEPVAVALEFCARCEVRAECLDWAIETYSDVGIFGGTTGRGRRKLHVGAGRAIKSRR